METIRRQLEPLLAGQVLEVSTVGVSERYASAVLADGMRAVGVRRRGKYLIVPLASADGDQAAAPALELVVHLGMTGQVRVNGVPDRHARVLVRAGRHSLVLRDARGFGCARVVPAGRYEQMPTLARLGPDILDPEWSPAVLAAGILGRSRSAKVLLLGQEHAAGVGNYMADEALWRARIRPTATRLSRARALRLGDALLRVTHESLAAGGVSERDFEHVDGSRGGYQELLSCYGRAGQGCLVCGRELVKSVVGGRGTTWCRGCQRR